MAVVRSVVTREHISLSRESAAFTNYIRFNEVLTKPQHIQNLCDRVKVWLVCCIVRFHITFSGLFVSRLGNVGMDSLLCLFPPACPIIWGAAMVIDGSLLLSSVIRHLSFQSNHSRHPSTLSSVFHFFHMVSRLLLNALSWINTVR